nr:unnamed protein product [Spirometra erinaceieuropaei]
MLGRALQKLPQASLRYPRRRHRPAAQVEINFDLDIPASLPETIRAMQQPSSGKAPGSDAISAEICEHSSRRLTDQLTTIFQETWRCGQAPRDSKAATIFHLYKRKENRQLCDKHGGVSLLNIT